MFFGVGTIDFLISAPHRIRKLFLHTSDAYPRFRGRHDRFSDLSSTWNQKIILHTPDAYLRAAPRAPLSTYNIITSLFRPIIGYYFFWCVFMKCLQMRLHTRTTDRKWGGGTQNQMPPDIALEMLTREKLLVSSPYLLGGSAIVQYCTHCSSCLLLGSAVHPSTMGTRCVQ